MIQHRQFFEGIKRERGFLANREGSPYPHLAVAEEGIEQFAERLPHPPA